MKYLLGKGKTTDKADSKTPKPSKIEDILYRPISEFSWKDATKSEIKLEAIPSYSERFKI
jgi:hypothetical protein